MFTGTLMGRMPVSPAGQGWYQKTPSGTGLFNTVPGPSVVLGQARVTCDQWLALSPAWRASLVRGVLESRGFSSLNNSTRGGIVYDEVVKINAYCSAQRAMRTAPAPQQFPTKAAGFAGVNMPNMGGVPVEPAGQTQLLPNIPWWQTTPRAAYSSVKTGKQTPTIPTQVTGAPPGDILSRSGDWALNQMKLTCHQWLMMNNGQKYAAIYGDARPWVAYVERPDVNALIARIDAVCARLQGGARVDRGFMQTPMQKVGMFGVKP